MKKLSDKGFLSPFCSDFCLILPFFAFSELCRFRRSWEGYHVADVLHARNEEDEPLETESEASMGAGAVLSGVEIPPHVLHRDATAVDLANELVVALLADGASYYLAYLREEDVGASPHG